MNYELTVPVAARSKTWVCGRSPAEIVGSNFTGGNGYLSLVIVACCQSLCDKLIIRPEESDRLLFFVVCDLENS